MLDKKKHLIGTPLPYLRNVNVRWWKFDTDDLFEMRFEDDERDRYGLIAGDVLVCEGGEPGRAAVWDERLPNMKFQKALHRLRCYRGVVPQYIVACLEHMAKSGWLERLFTGSTIKHFTGESLAQMLIPLPPFSEQEAIVETVEDQLSVIDHLEADLDAKLKSAQALRQAILRHAFTGKLVPQDPNDEPASELLKRIAAEREARAREAGSRKQHSRRRQSARSGA
jgi:type I restriction enzyme S subunit